MRCLFLTLISTFLIGCVQKEVSIERTIWGSVALSVSIKKISPASNDDRDVVVYADISLKAVPQHIDSIDLNCFALRVNEYVSTEIYSDTYVDISLNHRSVINGELSANVYWYFEKTKPMPIESSTFDIVVQKTSVEECHKEEVWQYRG